MVLRRRAGTGIHDKDDNIRFSHGLLRLLRHLTIDAANRIRLKSSCIDNDIFVFALLPVAVVPVTRQSGKVCNDGIPGFSQAIKECRFPDVGTPYQGNHWLHGILLFNSPVKNTSVACHNDQRVSRNHRRDSNTRTIRLNPVQRRAIIARQKMQQT